MESAKKEGIKLAVSYTFFFGVDSYAIQNREYKRAKIDKPAARMIHIIDFIKAFPSVFSATDIIDRFYMGQSQSNEEFCPFGIKLYSIKRIFSLSGV